MSTKIPANPNPFTDPNAALQMFNEYFGNLRNQYGEDVVRQVGFTPKEFQDLQAKLRNLQTDRSATPEQHREAYMQARDTLARRLTTPLEATRSYSMVQQPKPAPSPPVANDGTMPLVTPMTVMPPDMKSPTQEQLYAYARAVGRGETGQWDPSLGTFVMTAQRPQPQPQQGGLTQAQQPVMPTPPPLPVMPPPEREVIGFKTPPPGVRSGDTRIFADQPVPQPVTRQPFDPNAALQTFNNRAAELNASGKGLFASGMVPDEFRMYQGILRNLQLNPNSTPEQHADILNKSMAFLNQYSGATVPTPQMPSGYVPSTFGNKPVQPSVPGVELPVANTGGNIAPRTVPHDYDPAAQYRDFGQQLLGLIKSGAMTVEQANALKAPVFDAVKLGNSAEGYQQMQNALGAASQPVRNALVAGGQQMGGQNMGVTVKPVMPPPPMPQGVGMAPQMPQGMTLSNVPQQPATPQGMAMGGLLRKYYGGGMC